MDSKYENKVKIDLHYEFRKNKLHVYRNDTEYFPAFNEEEHKSLIDHVRSIMETNKASLYIQRIDKTGMPFPNEYKYVNTKMYSSLGNGVVKVSEWNPEEKYFNRCENHIIIKDFIKDLNDEIGIQSNWIQLGD